MSEIKLTQEEMDEALWEIKQERNREYYEESNKEDFWNEGEEE